MSEICFTGPVVDPLRAWAEAAYPMEACGLLIGRTEGGVRVVVRLDPLTNVLLTDPSRAAPTLPHDRQGQGKGHTEFLIDPKEFYERTLRAEREGLDVVGIVHTHPDHPAKPSAVDASQPLLAGWSNVIVSVRQGLAREARSWFRARESDPFAEERVRLEVGGDVRWGPEIF